MRKTTLIIIAILAANLQGCIVKSVYPFFREDDVVYRESFEGTWVDGENIRWRIHRNTFKPNSYELHCTKNGRDASLLGHLFSLNGNLYLDVVPLQDNTEELLVFDLHMVPTHSIARVDQKNSDEIEIRWFNEEWLREMFSQNKIRIPHEMIMDANPKSEDDGMYLLTASTEEVRKFIIKYGDTEKAFESESDELKIQLTRTR